MVKPLYTEEKPKAESKPKAKAKQPNQIMIVALTIVVTVVVTELILANYFAYLWLASHNVSASKLFSVQANREFAFEPEN
jgi:hypothetical protein